MKKSKRYIVLTEIILFNFFFLKEKVTKRIKKPFALPACADFRFEAFQLPEQFSLPTVAKTTRN